MQLTSTTSAPETKPGPAVEPRRANPYVQTLGGILVAILTTSISSTLGASATTNLIVALLGAVLPSFVTYVGPWRRLRLGVAAAAAAVALFATFGGLTLFDAAAEEQTVPWSPKPEPTAQPTVVPSGGGGGGRIEGRHVSVTPAVDCTADGCRPDVLVSNVGTEPIEVFTPEITGDPAGAFSVGQACAGRELAPGDSCSFPVMYAPQSDQSVEATLLVHHDVGPDPSAVRLTGSGGPQPVSGNVSFAQPPACQRADDSSLIVTATVVADAGAGQVAVAVLAADESLLASGALTVGQQGAVPVPETAADSTVRVRIDPDGTVQGDEPGDNSADVACAA